VASQALVSRSARSGEHLLHFVRTAAGATLAAEFLVPSMKQHSADSSAERMHRKRLREQAVH